MRTDQTSLCVACRCRVGRHFAALGTCPHCGGKDLLDLRRAAARMHPALAPLADPRAAVRAAERAFLRE